MKLLCLAIFVVVAFLAAGLDAHNVVPATPSGTPSRAGPNILLAVTVSPGRSCGCAGTNHIPATTVLPVLVEPNDLPAAPASCGCARPSHLSPTTTVSPDLAEPNYIPAAPTSCGCAGQSHLPATTISPGRSCGCAGANHLSASTTVSSGRAGLNNLHAAQAAPRQSRH